MAKPKEPKKEVITRKIEGELSFRGADANQVRMEMGADPNVRIRRVIELSRGILPGDFEASKYAVSGRFVFEVTVTEK